MAIPPVGSGVVPPSKQRELPKGDYAALKGDTLWGIAKTLAKQAGPVNDTAVANLLNQLRALNPHLQGDRLMVGDPVVFPKGSEQAKGWLTKVSQTAGPSVSVESLQQVPTVPVTSPLLGQVDAAGDKDNRVSWAEAEAAAQALMQRVNEAAVSFTTMPAEALDALHRDFLALKQLSLTLEARTHEQDNVAGLAAKIDDGAHLQNGELVGYPDGKLTRFEVETFVKDRAARAHEATRRGDTEAAASEQTLMEVGKRLVKLIPRE